ncbi:MAG: phage holin family protein [Deltaproteobacteria bacterium]|nr:MAG: phage holin family protein [Deltaproteobacteria bacterium]
MPGFLLRLAISAFGLWLASAIVPGVKISGAGTLVAAAFLLGVVNALVRPLVILLTLPITVVTLGVFLLVVNAAMLGLVAALLPNFELAGLLSAVLGALVVSLTGWMASFYVGPRGRVDVLIVRRDV